LQQWEGEHGLVVKTGKDESTGLLTAWWLSAQRRGRRVVVGLMKEEIEMEVVGMVSRWLSWLW
jgi:hypothetical protein